LAQTTGRLGGVAVAAQLVTAPLVAAISGNFSVVAVAANLAVAR
jgi:competence protein ComEC